MSALRTLFAKLTDDRRAGTVDQSRGEFRATPWGDEVSAPGDTTATWTQWRRAGKDTNGVVRTTRCRAARFAASFRGTSRRNDEQNQLGRAAIRD